MSNEVQVSSSLQISKSGGIKITTLAELGEFASMVTRAGFAPKGMNPEQAAIAMQLGMELGLNPLQAIQNIAVINGHPSVYGDALVGLVQASGLLENYEERMTQSPTEGQMASVRVTRKGIADQITRHFSEADAKKAKLWGKAGPWTDYPKRMLMIRARTWALRDMFADVLKGLTSMEEAQDKAETTLPAVTVIPPKVLPALDMFGKPGKQKAVAAAPPEEPDTVEETKAPNQPQEAPPLRKRGRPPKLRPDAPPPPPPPPENTPWEEAEETETDDGAEPQAEEHQKPDAKNDPEMIETSRDHKISQVLDLVAALREIGYPAKPPPGLDDMSPSLLEEQIKTLSVRLKAVKDTQR